MCKSSWAIGAIGAATDRLCIHSNNKLRMPLSVEDLLSCCYECGFGCDGGYTDKAWEYLNVFRIYLEKWCCNRW